MVTIKGALAPKVSPIWLILWEWIGIELKKIKHQTTKSLPHTDGLVQSIEISDKSNFLKICKKSAMHPKNILNIWLDVTNRGVSFDILFIIFQLDFEKSL